MNDEKRLIDYFPDWTTNGIFKRLSTMVPTNKDWNWLRNNADELDLEYFGNHSGSKRISPLTERFLENDELSDDNKNKLASIIQSRYSNNWLKLSNIYNYEYNPIHNYDMTESENIKGSETNDYNESTLETPNITKTHTPDITDTETPNLTKVRTPNLTDTETPNITIEDTKGEQISIDTKSDDNVYGFNSSAGVPSDSSTEGTTEKHSGTNTNKETGTRTTLSTGNETEVESGTRTIKKTGTETEVESGTYEKSYKYLKENDDNTDRTLERKGNIGVTTTQNMLNQEINLWNWNFVDTLFRNVDTILTIYIY